MPASVGGLTDRAWAAALRRRLGQLSFALLCAALLLPGAAAGHSELADEHRALHRTWRAGALLSWDWKQRTLTPVPPGDPDLGAQVLLVHLWAPWCGPCLSEFHSVLAAIQSRRKDLAGVKVLFVLESRELGPEAQRSEMADALDKLCGRPDMRDLCRGGRPLPGRWLLDAGETIWRGLEQDKLPLTLVLDGQRVVRDAYVGSLLQRLPYVIDSAQRLRQREGGSR